MFLKWEISWLLQLINFMTFKFQLFTLIIVSSEQAENWTFTMNICTVYFVFNFSKPLLPLPRHRATLDDWWQSVGQVLVCKNGWSRSRQNAQTRHIWDGNGGLFIAENYNYLQWHIAIHFSQRSKNPFSQKVDIYIMERVEPKSWKYFKCVCLTPKLPFTLSLDTIPSQ